MVQDLGLEVILDRKQQLLKAIDLIGNIGQKVTKQSSIYETAPIGYTDQPNFLNLCLEIETELSPQQLLKHCLDIEQQLHREEKYVGVLEH